MPALDSAPFSDSESSPGGGLFADVEASADTDALPGSDSRSFALRSGRFSAVGTVSGTATGAEPGVTDSAATPSSASPAATGATTDDGGSTEVTDVAAVLEVIGRSAGRFDEAGAATDGSGDDTGPVDVATGADTGTQTAPGGGESGAVVVVETDGATTLPGGVGPAPSADGGPAAPAATDSTRGGDTSAPSPSRPRPTTGGDPVPAPNASVDPPTTLPPSATASPSPAPGGRALAFYGMEWTADPRPGDLEAAAGLGVDTVMVDFDGTDPARWRAQLDRARGLGLKVVANYWHGGPAWTRNGSGWEIRPASRRFVETVAGHPALLAVYLLHEPYWNGGNEITTAQQRDLYRQVKAIADRSEPPGCTAQRVHVLR